MQCQITILIVRPYVIAEILSVFLASLGIAGIFPYKT